jgi:phosphoglycerate dehydrogenase-like enzyme
MSSQNPIEVLSTVRFSQEQMEKLQQLSPRVHLTILPAKKISEIPAEVWARTEILFTGKLLPEVEQVPNLRWIQFDFAGIEFAFESPFSDMENIRLTSLKGASAPQVAEYVMMSMLALGHKIPDLLIHQNEALWPKDSWHRFQPVELRGSTVGIVGYGSIGRELARLLQPFDVTILATKRDMMHPEASGYMISGLGDPGGDLFTRLYPTQALVPMVKDCDFVVVTIPHTKETFHLINAEVFAAMKSTAYLIDVSRGNNLNPDALKNALENGEIAGAALDVFPEEPLPEDSIFWNIPNLIISPHIAASSVYYRERAVALFAANLERYIQGKRLFNCVDKQTGY